MGPRSILLIEDHPAFRVGLRTLLVELDPDFTVQEAADLDEAQALENQDAIDLVLLDLYDGSKRDAMRAPAESLSIARRHFVAASIVVISSEDDPAIIRDLIDGGASGYIPKSSPPDVLIAALRLIGAGGVYLPPAVLQRLGQHRLDRTAPGASPTPLESLSGRQREVLLRAIQGKMNKVIAHELGIADGTVKAHLSAAYRALGVRNRTEAVVLLGAMGPRLFTERKRTDDHAV